jgi:hypothetical protein
VSAATGSIVRVRRAARRVFETESPNAADPELRDYLFDLVAPYGLTLREDLLAGGVGQSYADMAATLVAELADAPLDLLVLAHAMPDVLPGQPTAMYLSHICPGNPFAFAVCDQGLVAPFTAISLARSYVGSNGHGRALVLVVEQSALHYVPASPPPIPTRHTAVGLLLDLTAATGLNQLTVHRDVEADAVAGLFARELHHESDVDPVLVLGGQLAARIAPAALPNDVRIAPVGQPCTGPWWELAEGLAGWAGSRRPVLLMEYEPDLRYFAVLRLGPCD